MPTLSEKELHHCVMTRNNYSIFLVHPARIKLSSQQDNIDLTMNYISNPSFSRLATPLAATAAFSLLLMVNACRPSSEKDETNENQAVHVPHLHQNNLKNAQSSLLISQATSPINWQPWSKKVFADAAKEKKTVFAFVGSGTDSYSMSALRQLNESPLTCSTLNDQHVNILVDSNLHPDIEFYAATLCLKSGTSVSSPLLIWFSYEGIPISWIPISRDRELNIAEFISRTSNTVSRMWNDSPDYVLSNSREDFTRRMASPLPIPAEDQDPLIPIRATRQAASLFDPTSSTIDGLGGMSVARYIELLTVASYHPDVSNIQRERYMKISKLTADNMLLSGLIDPLDGGIYSGIQQSTTALPIFSKKLRTQAYSMSALYSLYQASGEKRYLQAADAIAAYTEKKLLLPDGGYALGMINAYNNAHDNPCTWTLEELEAALSAEELDICKLAFGIEGLGNIPLVDDRDRTYFRQNTLTWKMNLSELSAASGLDGNTLNKRLESITKKLAKLRTEKTSPTQHEKLSTAETTALLARSYIMAYRATSNIKHLDQAKKILTFIRDQFFDQAGELHHARFKGQLLNIPAVGADYTRVCQASLDLHEVTLDPTWLQLASDLHQRLSKNLGNSLNYHIMESMGADYPYPFNPYQFLTFRDLDNSNTWNLTYTNAKRLSSHQTSKELQAQCDELKEIILATIKMSALASIDFLTADAKMQLPTVYIKMPVSPELLKASIKGPCQIIAVPDKQISENQYPELGSKVNDIPAQGATVIQNGKILGSTTQAEELTQFIQ